MTALSSEVEVPDTGAQLFRCRDCKTPKFGSAFAWELHRRTHKDGTTVTARYRRSTCRACLNARKAEIRRPNLQRKGWVEIEKIRPYARGLVDLMGSRRAAAVVGVHNCSMLRWAGLSQGRNRGQWVQKEKAALIIEAYKSVRDGTAIIPERAPRVERMIATYKKRRDRREKKREWDRHYEAQERSKNGN